jgi:7,8-dihydroneopterin aldolase/epimerase/oxygenase
MIGRIQMKNMVFYGHHGDMPEERVLGQRFIIDLELSLNMAEAARTDDLAKTVDYVGVYEMCRQMLERERVNLLETLASHLADRILADHPRVLKVEITVKKPSVPLRGALDYVAIELSKEREDSLPGSGK